MIKVANNLVKDYIHVLTMNAKNATFDMFESYKMES